jgi:hypothetical protein
MTGRQKMINKAVVLLNQGLLPSGLPARLMELYNLVPVEAQAVARAALLKRVKRKRAEAAE